MSTAIEQAISCILEARQPITVSNVLPAYLQFADIASAMEVDPEFAIITFEHALDKHPAPLHPPHAFARQTQSNLKSKTITYTPPLCKRLYHTEVEQLRKDYWRERLGSIGGTCTCAGCGRTVRFACDEDLLSLEAAPVVAKTRSSIPKRKSRKRIARHVCAVDSFSTSTSAAAL